MVKHVGHRFEKISDHPDIHRFPLTLMKYNNILQGLNLESACHILFLHGNIYGKILFVQYSVLVLLKGHLKQITGVICSYCCLHI